MPSLIGRIPDVRIPEHTWIVNTLLTTYLGLDVEVTTHEHPTVQISHSSNAKSFTVPSILLTENPEEWALGSAVPAAVPFWADPRTLPWNTPQPDVQVPVLFVGPDPETQHIADSAIHLPWDLFGSAFFMLTRLEEVLLADADSHGRFPAASALAVKEGFERIPVVNAWGEIIRGALLHLWPGLQTRKHEYQVQLSHDVDEPLVSDKHSLAHVLKSSAGDILVRRSPVTSVRRFVSSFLPASLRPRVNPGNTFDFIMRESERLNLKSAFYFITENTAGRIDGTYSLEMPFIHRLLEDIHKRGHEIGLHPGYESYRSRQRIQSGFNTLRGVTDRLGIDQAEWGGRQHFLRWSAAETWRHWNSAGLTYDSSVGYAETVGFRAGACFEYPVFDIVERRELSLKERPLIVMEASLFKSTSPVYLSLTDSEGLAIMSELVDTVHAYGGTFALLWHNSSLVTPQQQRLYTRVLAELSRGFGS